MINNTDFFNAYSSVHRPLTNHLNRILEKHDLSSSYWRVLRILEKTNTITFGEISDALYIEKPAVTKVIKKLVTLNIVEIHRGQDKREKLVTLTTDGKEKVAVIRAELNPFLELAIDGVSQDQLLNAIEVLELIQKNITK